MDYRAITLKDSRILEWADNGIDSDSAIIFHNGTTCGLEVWLAWFDEAAKAGVRAIGINRPGIGSSSRNKGRKIIDDVNDIRELVEQLGIKRFVSIGWSGGGARALGSALVEGCVGVQTIAGIPQPDADDPLWMAAVSPERHERNLKNRADYDEMVRGRSATFKEDQNMTAETMLGMLKEYMPRFAEFEREYERFAEDFSTSIRQALKHGPQADGDDFWANIHPWGFEYSQVKVPVTIWHGDLDDDVEVKYGAYNHSRLPGSKFVELEGLGHVDIMVELQERILNSALQDLETQSKSN